MANVSLYVFTIVVDILCGYDILEA